MNILFDSVLAANEHKHEIEARKIFGMDVDVTAVYLVISDSDRAYDYFEKTDPERTHWSTDDGGVVYFISKEENGMKTYSLINYFDVWGNAEDGYEVNNLCVEFDDLTIDELASDNDIIDYLYNIGFLNNNDYEKFTVESFDADFIEIFASDDMYPICRLQAKRR